MPDLMLSSPFADYPKVVQIKMQNLFRSTFASLILVSLLTPPAYSFGLAANVVAIDQQAKNAADNRSPGGR